jgi:predicted phosphodiesterase
MKIQKLSSGRKILVLPDIHVPYHNMEAIRTALTDGRIFGADTVILLGDTMDCHMLSTHKKMRGALDMVKEVEMTRELMAFIRKALPKAEIFYMEGNHEQRLTRHMEENSPALVGFDAITLPSLLNLEEDFNIKYLRTGELITCGRMTFIHGHELKGLGGINPARKLYLRAKTSTICGHFHRPDTFFTRDIRGEGIECHVLGTLGSLSPHYHPLNEWRHGYGLVDIAKSGKFKVHNQVL